MLNQSSSLAEHPSEIWAHISHSKCAAENTIGCERIKPKNQWYDEEYRDRRTLHIETLRNQLQPGENYRKKKKEAKRISKQKKRQQERQEPEELEMLTDRN